MPPQPTADVADGAAQIRVTVTHAGKKTTLLFPAASATVGALKDELARRSGVPRERQRLMFGGPVLKQHRREGRSDVRLIDLVAEGALSRPPTHETSVGSSSAAPPSSSSVITIPVMLIGAVAAAPQINEEAMAQLHRLVPATVEVDGALYACSYGKGYVRQLAYVCRTCVRSGRASPAHAMCFACAEVCHSSHDVEEWGMRYYMRCDCCTPACWKNDDKEHSEESVNPQGKGEGEGGETEEVKNIKPYEPRACCFLVDRETCKPLMKRDVVPMNSKNRYPRTLHSWCYCDCEDNHPEDDPDGGGVVCMLCATCYWSSHMTRLCTDALRRVPCYGDVVEGNVVAFHCNTCDTLVCSPCRLRCHKNHDVDPKFVFPSRAEGTDNGAPDGVEFSCGCRGLCSIAEVVPEAEVNDPAAYMRMSPDAAVETMNSDPFMGFICARCMQENPWIVEDDSKKCYKGVLPEKIPEQHHKPVVACRLKADAPCASDVYPYHGMLFPVNAFTEDMTCSCTPCREAYEQFAPRATTTTVNEMMSLLHDKCDNCEETTRNAQAFMCLTCEMQQEQNFFICNKCNKRRLAKVMPDLGNARSSIDGSGGNDTNLTSVDETIDAPSSNNNNNTNNENNSNNNNSANDGGGAVDDAVSWDHPLDHVFMEDTFENLFNLCSMQILRSLDRESQAQVLDNIDTATVSFEGILQRHLGQTSVVVDPDDVAKHHQQLTQRTADSGEQQQQQVGEPNDVSTAGTRKRSRGNEKESEETNSDDGGVGKRDN